MYSSGNSAARLLTGSHAPLGLGWLVPLPRFRIVLNGDFRGLVPRFALVDRLEVIKSLYGRTAAWPRLGHEDVRNAALQRPVAFAAVHVVERRRCHPAVDHVARLCKDANGRNEN